MYPHASVRPKGSVPPSVGSVANQSLTFGRLTLAGAGGTAPVATGGSITSASIDSGTNANHWQVTSGGIFTPTTTGYNAGLSSSYSLSCTFNGHSGVTITINTTASCRSVKNIDTEVLAALAQDVTDAAGAHQLLYRATTPIVASSTGPRRVPTKIPGVDTLPANCSYSAPFLTVTGSTTFGTSDGSAASWDFTGVAVVVRGNSTTANFYDCLFAPNANNPAVGDTQFYGLQVSDNGTTPTVNVNYCKFDGKKYTSNYGTAGPWSGSAIYVLASATLTADHCLFTGIPYDVVKQTNATYTQTNCYIQAFGWNPNCDADGIQMISGTTDAEKNIYDISDGGATALGAFFPGLAPNSCIFCTIDSPSLGNGAVTFKNNLLRGWSGYTLGNNPVIGVGYTYPSTTNFNPLNLADNHTAGGMATGFHIVGGVWKDNILESGNQGYWTYGGTEVSATAITTWSGNIDISTGASIATPSFGASGPTWVTATFGASGKVVSGAALTGANSPTKLLFACNLNANAATNGGTLFIGNGQQNFYIRFVGSGDNLRTQYASTVLDLTDSLTTNGETIVVISIDTTKSTDTTGVVAYANDTPFGHATVTWTQNTTANLGNESDWDIGSSTSFGDGTPKLKWLYFDYGNQAGTYPDFTVQANRDKLKTGTLLSDGSNVCGAAPLVFFGGTSVTDWTTPVNHGGSAGGTWTKSGSIT